MAEGMATARAGSLVSKLDSKICYHRDAALEYMEIKAVVGEVIEEKEMLQHDYHALKDELEAAKKTIVEVNKELAAGNEETSLNKKELDLVKKKLQDWEAKQNLPELQNCSASEHVQPSNSKQGQKRSMRHQEVPSQGPLRIDADKPDLAEERPGSMLVNNPIVGQTSVVSPSTNDDMVALREHLIKQFLEIDKYGGRIIGIKEMGKLNVKAFEIACAGKVRTTKAADASSKLYSLWQQRITDVSWNPFNTVMVEGNRQEVLNVNDDKLQELKKEWGEGPYKAVIDALMEMKEYNCLGDRSTVYELWNYRADRKATLTECTEYMADRVQELTVVKRRRSRRMI
ncbi:factor of DNA methylation 5-like isoform X1 [Triticum dicoccoides]|uniref:factor of DNA methylation 5-like isoform X1 n=1 Tax=Triticum dicoccoides TaxID=85692 RepID=UPI00188F452D|nr:factor of DNA methylation 5-like isoform X1 [Triticum dicoccoides]XP_037487137.1 factor of DNA methylation 5-like isoform X1 [Triticum dicoccoides]